MSSVAKPQRRSLPPLARWISVFACALAALGLAGAAQAQSTRAAASRSVVLIPLEITHLQDMDFGRIAGSAAGTVVMTASATPTCTPSAGLAHVGMCAPMGFAGSGDTQNVIRIKKPPGDTVTLTGPGADMTVTAFKIDGSPELQLINETQGFSRYRIVSADGVFHVRVGGTLNVGANQAPGVYTGVVEIDVAYN